MTPQVDQTIAAVASAPGGAMRGIIRLAGPQVIACLERCFRPCRPIKLREIKAARVVAGQLELPPPLGLLPSLLYLWPGCRSYTRQPAAEIHTIGSPPLLQEALGTLCRSGARLAEPGEFTLRAFLAGRLDLTQAEAVLGVIDARSQSELDGALDQLAGGLRTPLDRLRNKLLDLLAHLEATLDFADEDIPLISPQQLQQPLAEAADQIQQLCRKIDYRNAVESEVRIVLRGWPNVGKSSLLNALAGRPVALVSPESGTTRDYVTCHTTLLGIPCLLIDTAGWQPATEAHPIDAAAQTLGSQQQQRAHLELFCLDASRPLNNQERRALSCPAPGPRLIVLTKGDLPRVVQWDQPAMVTSSKTGLGLDQLRRQIARTVGAAEAGQEQMVGLTAARCGQSLRLAAQCLGRARRLAATGGGEELIAVEMRAALDELGKIIGAVYTEDVLDRIFSRFCIGK